MHLIEHDVGVVPDLIRTVHEDVEQVAGSHVDEARLAGREFHVPSDAVANLEIGQR